jgi:hypothetical protein
MSKKNLWTPAELEAFINRKFEERNVVPVLLRFHLLTDHLLNRLIVAGLPQGQHIVDNGRLSYHQKIELVRSLEILSEDVIASLRQLNILQNKCSRFQPTEIELSVTEVHSIAKPLGRIYWELRRSHGFSLKALSIATFKKLYSKILRALLVAENPKLKDKIAT